MSWLSVPQGSDDAVECRCLVPSSCSVFLMFSSLALLPAHADASGAVAPVPLVVPSRHGHLQFGEMGSGVMHTALWARVYACLRIRVHVAVHVEACVQVCPRVHVRVSGGATPFRDWSVSVLLEPRPPAPWGPLWATGALAASPGSCLNSAWWLALSTRFALWMEVPFPAAPWLTEATGQV